MGLITKWSASSELMTGYTAAEIVGRSFSCFFSTIDIESGEPQEVLRVTTEDGWNETVRTILRKDGSQFLARLVFGAFKDAAGNLLGFSETCHDLSKRTHLDERYQDLQEAATDGLVVFDKAGAILLLDARAEKQLGYRRDELIGKHLTHVILEGLAGGLDTEEVQAGNDSPRQKVGKVFELAGFRKDGIEFSIEVTLNAFLGLDGTEMTAVIREIKSRKDAERRLSQMEAKYLALLEAVPDGIVVVSESEVIVSLNAQAEKQFGYDRDELLGQLVTNIIPEGFHAQLVADRIRTTEGAPVQQIGVDVELHGLRKDSSQFPIEIMLSPLKTEEGLLVIAAVRDISERKQQARQLNQSEQMDAVGQLTRGIAHDFNNLLTVIIGNLGLAEILLSDNQPAVKRINSAQKAALRSADITRRLLAFSRHEDLKPTLVSLGKSIQNVIDTASRGLGLNLKITTQIDESVPPVFVDNAALESALLNILINSRDALSKGGAIVISTSLENLDENHPAVKVGDLKEGFYACVEVSDSGRGMSQEILDRVYEPFFTTKPYSKAAGLGLSMVYGFVRESGGAVSICSELGIGTSVTFYLPVFADLANPIPATVSA